MHAAQYDDIDAAARELCTRLHGASVIDATQAQSLLRQVANIHGVDVLAHYWWEAFPAAKRIFYGHASGLWKREVAGLLSSKGPGAYLAVTDDEAPPWPVVWVEDPSRIVAMIEDMHFFEYFVFSSDCSRIFFDTHSNMLVASTR